MPLYFIADIADAFHRFCPREPCFSYRVGQVAGEAACTFTKFTTPLHPARLPLLRRPRTPPVSIPPSLPRAVADAIPRKRLLPRNPSTARRRHSRVCVLPGASARTFVGIGMEIAIVVRDGRQLQPKDRPARKEGNGKHAATNRPGARAVR